MDRKKIKKIFIISVMTVFVLFSVFCIMTWPLIIASKEKELTGYSFDFKIIRHFDDGAMREGCAAWIYHIPKSISQKLEKNKNELARYPMWNALAFDGYKQVRWQNLSTLRKGKHKIVYKRFLYGYAPINEISKVNTLKDIWGYSNYVMHQEDTLIAGWYTTNKDADSIDNYFIYIMNLRLGLVVKLVLLT